MKNLKNFFTSYVSDILSVVKEYDHKKLDKIYSEIEKVILRKKKIYFFLLVDQAEFQT